MHIDAKLHQIVGPRCPARHDEYTFAHNAIVTLVGPEGGIVRRFSSDAVVDNLARALRRLIDLAALNS